ncbi:g7021 [Coccomyxa elongata]
MSTPSKKKRKTQSVSQQSELFISKSNISDALRDDCPSSIALQAGKVLYFEGKAEISVTRGAVWLNGTYLEAGSAKTTICADAVLGGALPIEAVPSGTKVPHPHQDVQMSFHPPMESGESATASNSSGVSPVGPRWRVLPDGACAAYHSPQDWREAAAGVSAAIAEACAAGRSGGRAVAVAGAKGTGKTSFARLLANSILNHVPRIAWLDADCGQPEFTVPGLVSLTYVDCPIYGLPHMHQRAPAQARFVGQLSPERDPIAYRGAVEELLTWHAAHHASTPLIINTCGWIKGLGLDLLADLLQTAQPSHVVLLQTANARRNLPAEPFWAAGDGPGQVPAPASIILQLQAVGQLHAEGATTTQKALGAPAAPKKLTAAETRSLSWLVWAHDILHLPSSGVRWEADTLAAAARGLAAHTPYTVRLADVAVEVLHVSLPPNQLGYVLNGALVGLCSRSHRAVTDSLPPAGQEDTVCMGVGIVRAVDMTQGRAYMLAPLDLGSMQKVNVLQVGRLELPPELLQSGPVVSPYLSTWSIGTAGTGAGAIKSRNNLARAAQLVA